MLNPGRADYCRLDPAKKAKLVVVVDTEEEFDWAQSFSRENTSVRSIQCIGRVQGIFDAYGIKPVYVIDYPVASQPDGYQPLREIHLSNRCVIGAHLHPWVNPPFGESVNRENSFPGNLPRVLETAKLKVLGECIRERFGIVPTIYKAGRYGIGAATLEILEELGYEVDLSVCPHMDYSAEGGPSFSGRSAWPYWFGKRRRLLELPLTVGFAGLLRRYGTSLHQIATRRFITSLRAPSILARLGLVDKIWLSPEGYTPSEHVKLVRTLYRDGLRVFSFAFHSPSVDPGNTPYVRSQRELDQFLSSCRKFFDFFMGELQGRPVTPLELKKELSESCSTTHEEV